MLQTKKFAHPSVCCSYHKNISSWNGNLFASKILTPQVRQWHSRNLQNNFTIPVQTNSQKHCKPASEAIHYFLEQRNCLRMFDPIYWFNFELFSTGLHLHRSGNYLLNDKITTSKKEICFIGLKNKIWDQQGQTVKKHQRYYNSKFLLSL